MTRTNIKLGLDVSDVISGAGQAARKIDEITEAMAKAEREGRGDDVARLARDRERLDPAGGILSKADRIGDVIRGLDTRIAEARQKGNQARAGELYLAKDKLQTAALGMERDAGNLLKDPRLLQIMNKKAEGHTLTRGEEEYFARLETLNDTLRKNTEALLDANREGDTKELLRQSSQIGEGARDLRNIAGQGDSPQSGRGMHGAVMSMALGQISNAISSGLSRWTGSLDRSGIVAQYGSGDIHGARLSERRRQDNLVGGAADTIAGMSNMLAFLGPKGIAAAGAINLGTGIFNAVRQGRTNIEATNIAKSELWQQRSDQAMELAALIGNPGAVREAFEIAADAAARFGFSAEEGMAAMNQAAQQGLDRAMAEVKARQVFDFERRTGADRGALSSLANMSARFNAGDALGDAWAGLKASGMSSGQFNEYLRAMQRVMEDGISRGFVRSSEDVAKNLTMLAQLAGGDNPLWQGEHGARRLSEMNAGLEAATALSSASDVIALRAARKIIGDDSSYIYAMKLMEEGLTPALFRNFMDLTSKAEGGAMEGIIERMRQTLGLNYTNAYALFTGWRNNPQFMDDNYLEGVLQRHGAILPTADSAELEARRITEGVTNWWTTHGMNFFDSRLPYLRDAYEEASRRAASTPPDTAGMSRAETRDAWAEERRHARESGDSERIALANRQYRLAALEFNPIRDPRTRQAARLDIAKEGLFGRDRDDRNSARAIQNTFLEAMMGGDAGKRGMAEEFMSTLMAVPNSTREAWNQNNNVNLLAQAGNMAQMLAKLDRLIDLTERNGNVTLTIE